MLPIANSPPSVSPQARQLADAIQAAAEGHVSSPLPQNATGDIALLCSTFSVLQSHLSQKSRICTQKEQKRRTAIAEILHDLRIPLTTIIGYTEALQKHLDQTPEKRDAYLAAIMLRAKDLSLLIDKLSEANKNEDASHKELTNLSSLIQEFTTSRKDKIQEKQIRLRMDLDKTLELPLDRQSFQRVLLNLFANTVKYRTRPYSVVQITCLKKNGEVFFSYHDDGPGVPPDALPHLFKQGFRGKNTLHQPGSGLGLHIIAKVASAHHGTASAQNENGLTITITLPLTGGLSC